jgi:hypothetical protein
LNLGNRVKAQNGTGRHYLVSGRCKHTVNTILR